MCLNVSQLSYAMCGAITPTSAFSHCLYPATAAVRRFCLCAVAAGRPGVGPSLQGHFRCAQESSESFYSEGGFQIRGSVSRQT
jgi:hypothetical protein